MNYVGRWLWGMVMAATLSCATTKPTASNGSADAAGRTARPTAPVITPDSSLRGQVVFLNARARYVVVNFPVGRMAAPGQVLNVYRRDLKVGEVRVDTWRRDDNVVADLIAGEAQPGDEVRER